MKKRGQEVTIELVEDFSEDSIEEPSEESLREMPELDSTTRYKIRGRGLYTHLRVPGVQKVPIAEDLWNYFGNVGAINTILRRVMEAAQKGAD